MSCSVWVLASHQFEERTLRCQEFLLDLCYVHKVLNTITEELFGVDETFRSAMDHFVFIRDVFAAGNIFGNPTPKYLYILVHNIDGESLRNTQTQLILSMLAGIPQIRMLASVDHVNSPKRKNYCSYLYSS